MFNVNPKEAIFIPRILLAYLYMGQRLGVVEKHAEICASVRRFAGVNNCRLPSAIIFRSRERKSF